MTGEKRAWVLSNIVALALATGEMKPATGGIMPVGATDSLRKELRDFKARIDRVEVEMDYLRETATGEFDSIAATLKNQGKDIRELSIEVKNLTNGVEDGGADWKAFEDWMVQRVERLERHIEDMNELMRDIPESHKNGRKVVPLPDVPVEIITVLLMGLAVVVAVLAWRIPVLERRQRQGIRRDKIIADLLAAKVQAQSMQLEHAPLTDESRKRILAVIDGQRARLGVIAGDESSVIAGADVLSELGEVEQDIALLEEASTRKGMSGAALETVRRAIADLRAKAEGRREGVFVSYSHRDKGWLDKLQTHLKPLVRKNRLSVWADTNLKAGEDWREGIRKAISRAKVAVLLVSPDFLDSDFIDKNELPPLLDAAKNEGLTVVWIPVSASSYKVTEIEKYQAAHDPDRPLDKLSKADQNRALVAICEKIQDAMRRSVP